MFPRRLSCSPELLVVYLTVIFYHAPVLYFHLVVELAYYICGAQCTHFHRNYEAVHGPLKD